MNHIAAVVLAAGKSSRMGEPKLLLPWRDTTVLGATLANVSASSVNQIVVVTGAYRQEVSKVARVAGIKSIHNPDFDEGEMLSSAQIGLQAVNGCAAVIILLGDMPLIAPRIIDQIARALRDGSEIVVPFFKGKKGHPVGFHANHHSALLALQPGQNPRDIIHANQDKLHRIKINNDAILIDLDDRATYEKYRPESPMAHTFTAFVVEKIAKREFTRSIQTRSTDDLSDGDMLIQVEYSSLNYKDALSATGHPGVTRNFPHTPGIDAAGTIVEDATGTLAPGTRVLCTSYDLGMETDGGFGQYIRVPAGWVVPLPENLSTRDAMIYGTAGLTAAMSVERIVDGGVKPEDGEVLVTGATGGVGSMAVALLAKLGYTVVAATGKKETAADFLHSLGATSLISREEATDTSRPLLRSRWAAVVDAVGGDMLTTALASTKYGAVVAVTGLVATHEMHTTVYPLILRANTIAGIDSGDYPLEKRTRLWNLLADEWRVDGLESMAREVGIAELETEIERILHGQQTGRVVVNLA